MKKAIDIVRKTAKVFDPTPTESELHEAAELLHQHDLHAVAAHLDYLARKQHRDDG